MLMNPPDKIALLTVFRRWWWALLVGGAVSGAVGYTVASRAPKTYEATAKALVGPVNTDLSLSASGALGRTYAELASSGPVLEAAIKATHARVGIAKFAKSVTANANDVTRLVTITVSDADPKTAAALANALVARLTTLALQVPPEFNTSIQTFDSQPEVTSLGAVAAQRVDQAARRTFGISPAGRLQTVDPAQPPTAVTSPKVPLIALLATIGGVIIAGLMALLKEAQGRRVLDEHALREIADPPFLGAVDGGRYTVLARDMVVEKRPSSAAASEYRVLGARLRLLGDNRRISSLAVLDAAGGTAAGVVAANLAAAVAEAGRSVLLIDAATSQPGVTSMLTLSGKPGYADVVSDLPAAVVKERLEELCVTRGHGLRILPRGSKPGPWPLAVDRVRSVLWPLTTMADLVVICGPSMLGSAEALTLAQASDAILLVVESDRTSRGELAVACADLARVAAEVLGTVLVRSGWRLRVSRLIRDR